MKPLKMNWAQTPYLRDHNDKCGHEALVSFDCYVDNKVFELVRNDFQGYIQRAGKKVALYNVWVIGELTKHGYEVQLDGVHVKSIPHQMQLTDYLLSISQTCTNDHVSYLANFRNQLVKWRDETQSVVGLLDNIFGSWHREGVVLPSELKWEEFKIGSSEYAIDVKHGIRKDITWDEPSHEYFVPVNVYQFLKPGESIEALQALVEQAKSLPKKPNINTNGVWQPGYDAKTFEPKGRKFGYR